MNFDTNEFYKHMIVTGKAKRTAENNLMYLDVFLKFAEENKITDLKNVNSSHIARFQEYLYFKHKSRQGKKLVTASQTNILLGVKTFFKFLVKTKLIAVNPVQDITMPKSKKSVPSPRDIFSISEIKTMLSIPDLNYAITYQDRVIMETALCYWYQRV
jgi:site-specific recombinase XerD